MRSLKEFQKFVDVFKLVSGCYYKMKMTDGDTWLFEFMEYNHDFNGGNCIYIISGESYCVESEHYFYETSGLCGVNEVMGGTVVKISLNEFNKVRGL
jgi:hypothetical protein